MGLESLFEPLQMRRLRLKNRFVLSAMSRYACPERIPTSDLASYHRRRAEGGAALSLTGACAIDHPAANNSPLLADFRPAAHDAWKTVVDGVHEGGGLIGIQLWHAGGRFNREPWWKPAPLVSPSGLGGPDQVVGEPLTEEDIADIIDEFGKAAAAAVKAGFDAIEIHGAHGFLIDQFFWSVTNQRTDRWGGPTLADRLEFGLEVYRAIRRAAGPDLPISMRISQWKEQDYVARLADTPETLRQWLEPFAEAGVDLFDCSQRRFWQAEFEGSDLNLAGWAKKLTGVPTLAVGSVGLDLDVTASFKGENAVPAALTELVRRFERGDFDLVGLGRVLLADPHWIEKVRDGRLDELQPFSAKAVDSVY
jgi:2,4-dienoyl-CoA reductase-like NADH-dependent reductase (Old Yellow Enzyme family)